MSEIIWIMYFFFLVLFSYGICETAVNGIIGFFCNLLGNTTVVKNIPIS